MRYQLALILLISLFCLTDSNAQTSFSKKEFLNPPKGVKVHAWWHWVDNAITKEGITKDLLSMKEQGVAQATILNVSLFNQKDFGVPKVKFNSPGWYQMFQWSLKEASRLGITLGAHNCDGWSSSGGPWITPEQSMKQYVWTKKTVSGGQTLSLSLAKPFAKNDFYKDVAVVAYKTNQALNSFQLATPSIRLNDSADAAFLLDGDPSSAISLKNGDRISIKTPAEFEADKIVIHPRRQFMWGDMVNFKSNFTLMSSDDGVTYKKVKDIALTGLNQSFETDISSTKSKYFQLVLNDYSTTDIWYGFFLAEVELLKKEETPSFAPKIAHLLEKTVAVKPQSQSFLNEDEQTTISAAVSEKNVVDISGYMTTDGTLKWQAPEGTWSIIRFGYTTTGAINAPATEEGLGLECDKMDKKALTHHFNSFSQKLADAAGPYLGNTFKFLLVDSWECGYQNWTQSFPEEFERRRGYKLLNYIPVLCGEVVESAGRSDAFLYDFRKTIADLIEENYYKPLSELCHKNKLEFHSEVIYGDANYPPLDVMRSNSYVDMPMYEFWAGTNQQSIPEYHPAAKLEANFPVYAAQLYNKPVVGAEAYTGFAHYSESPWNLKPFGDKAFCSGINQLILHSYVHQPSDKKPGMTLGGFAAHFNRNNPWWQYASGWMNYQARVQYVLQKGTIVSDLLYYVGDQLPQYVENPFLKNLPFGYRANACNMDVLKSKASVKNGKIVIGKDQEYHLLVLPDNKAMEWETMQRIAQLVKEGAVVYGPKPVTTFSTKSLKNKEALLRLANEVWGNEKVASGTHTYGKGKVFWGTNITDVLQQLSVKPDLRTGSADSLNLMYIHKKAGDKDIYFIANQQNESMQRECIFRVSGKNVEIWNPVYGNVVKPDEVVRDGEGVRVKVHFQPYEALIFIIGGNAVEKTPAVVQPQIIPLENIKAKIQFLPAYEETVPPVAISQLKSFTEFEDSAIRYFSGVARYTIQFAAPTAINNKDSVLISLGNLDATAEVRLNNKLIGHVWMPHFMLNVSGLLQPQNTLEIRVANTYRNRIIGDFRQHGDLKNVWTSADVANLLNKNKLLKPSGVMGPVQFIVYKKRTEGKQ